VRDTGSLLAAAGKLAVGSIAGYAVVVVLTPVLTRLYSPADLGAFSIVAAFVGVLPPLLTLGYHFGQLSARNRSESARFASSALVLSSVVGVALLIVGLSIAHVVSLSSQFSWAVVSALVCGLAAVSSSVAVNWAIRQGREGRAAWATFMNLGGRAVFQTGAGVTIGGVQGLVIGEVLGRGVAWAVAELGMYRVAIRRAVFRRRWVKRHVASQRNYPLVLTPALTAENLLVWLPAPVFAFAFGPDVGGFFALVQRFASVPLTVANQSLAALFHRELVGRYAADHPRVRRLLVMLAAIVAVCVVPLSAGFEVYGGALAGRLFGGEEWIGTATVAAAFVPVCAAQFLCLFTDRILLVAGRNGVKLAFLACALAMMFIVAVAAVLFGWSWQEAVWAYSVSQTLVYLSLFGNVIRSFGGRGHQDIPEEGK
jgi:O-antigen/teichoic acid export membrane protein